jgi:hypothetical protein
MGKKCENEYDKTKGIIILYENLIPKMKTEKTNNLLKAF